MNDRVNELLMKWVEQRQVGTAVTAEELCRECPELLPQLQKRIEAVRATDWMFDLGSDSQDSTGSVRRDGGSDHSAPIKIAIQQLGEYEIFECLGQGGMGTVYKARHRRLDKLVALKVLPPGQLKDKAAVARFEREMRAIGKLEHRHIVSAHDAGEVNGTHYLAMQLVDGVDVSRIIKTRGTLTAADACEIARQVAIGLQYIHEKGLVHRDVKPSNLIVGRDGTVKLLDLGLARIHTDLAGSDEITRSGHVMGTVDYMAPEQVEDSHSVDHRADLFSLGATLFKLLCGRSPLDCQPSQSNLRKLKALSCGEIPSLRSHTSGLPDDLLKLVDRLLSVSPTMRPQTAAAVVEHLEDLSGSHDLAALVSSVTGAANENAIQNADKTTRPIPNNSPTNTQPTSLLSQPSVPRPIWQRPAVIGAAVAAMSLLAFAVVQRPNREDTKPHPEDVASTTAAHQGDSQEVTQPVSQAASKEVSKETSTEEAKEEAKANVDPPDAVVKKDEAPLNANRQAEQWELVVKLLRSGVFIDVELPDETIRVIHKAEELPLIRRVTFTGPQATEDNLLRLLEFTSLEYLSLRELLATPKVLDSICLQTRLEVLYINKCDLIDDAMLSRFKALPALRKVALWNARFTDAGLVHFQNFPDLELLQIGFNRRLTGSGLEALKPLSQLRDVNLHSTLLNDDGLTKFKELPQVTTWAIGDSPWTNEGLKSLAGLTNVQNLSIDQSPLDDNGLAALSQLPNMTRLNAKATEITSAGVAQFRRALPACRLESDVIARSVNVPPLPTDEKARAELWEFLRSLKQGGFKIEVILPDGRKRQIERVEEIPLINYININGPLATNANLQRLLGATASLVIDIDSNVRLTAESFDALNRQVSLTKLRFNVSTALGDRQLERLKDLKHLATFNMWATSVTDAGLVHLQNFPDLETVQMGSSKGITGAGLSNLKPLKRLTVVHMPATSLNDEGLKQLAELPQISDLAIGGDCSWTNAGLKELTKLPRLQILLIDKSHLNDEGLEHLSELPNLQRLLAKGTKITPAGAAMFKAKRPKCALEVDFKIPVAVPSPKPAEPKPLDK